MGLTTGIFLYPPDNHHFEYNYRDLIIVSWETYQPNFSACQLELYYKNESQSWKLSMLHSPHLLLSSVKLCRSFQAETGISRLQRNSTGEWLRNGPIRYYRFRLFSAAQPQLYTCEWRIWAVSQRNLHCRHKCYAKPRDLVRAICRVFLANLYLDCLIHRRSPICSCWADTDFSIITICSLYFNRHHTNSCKRSPTTCLLIQLRGCRCSVYWLDPDFWCCMRGHALGARSLQEEKKGQNPTKKSGKEL